MTLKAVRAAAKWLGVDLGDDTKKIEKALSQYVAAEAQGIEPSPDSGVRRKSHGK